MSETTPEPTSAHTSGAGTAADRLRTAHRLDLATTGLGVLAFLGSLMPYYTVSFSGVGASYTAWHGFFGWFGALCALAGAAVLLAHVYGVPVPVPVRVTVFALFATGAVCTLLALVVTPGGDCDSYGTMGGICELFEQGHGFGYWLALVSTVAGSALAAMRRLAP